MPLPRQLSELLPQWKSWALLPKILWNEEVASSWISSSHLSYHPLGEDMMVPAGLTLLVSDEEAFGLCLRFYGCYLAFMGQIANLAPNESSNKADIHVLLDSCESYMIKKEDVENIIQKVQAAVSKWENLAILLQIPGREMDMFKERFKLNL